MMKCFRKLAFNEARYRLSRLLSFSRKAASSAFYLSNVIRKIVRRSPA